MDQLPIDKIRSAIESHAGRSGHKENGQWRLICPSHPDRQPSLMLGSNPEDAALLWCGGGCDTDTILSALGMTRRDLYPLRADDRRPDPVIATYRYVDEQGQLLFEVERTTAKKFRQRRPDPTSQGKWLYNLEGVRRVLYRLPHLIQAVSEGRTVWIVEGEKDVASIEARGHTATCNPGGAGKWRPEFTELFRDAHVQVVMDLDRTKDDGTTPPGEKHARQIAVDLERVAASVTLVRPAAGKDITDHLMAGHELEDTLIVPIHIGDQTPLPLPLQGKYPPSANGHGEQSAITEADAPLERQIRLTPASAFTIRAVQWVWDGRMPVGEICLIAGREGVGKSTFLAWMAAAVTNGNLPGIFRGKPKAVLYAAQEDAWHYTIAPRMLAAGANLDMVYRIDVVQDEGPSGLLLPRDCRELPEIARSVDAAMLMCDPILSLLDDRLNMNRSQELRKALEPLKRAAEAAELSIPALVHFNKTQGVDALSMISGSRAWAEVARAVLTIAQDHEAEDYECVVSQPKNNLGKTNLPNLIYTLDDVRLETEEGPEARVGRLRWTGESAITAETILRRAPSVGPSVGENTAAVVDWIREQDRAVSIREIMDQFPDVRNSTLKSILTRAKQRGQLTQPTSGMYSYAITEG